KGSLALGATVALPGLLSGCGSDLDFEFAGLPHGVGHDHLVDPEHTALPLLRWGDPVVAGAPEFDVHHQSAAAQEQQFGYNNDYIGLIPVERNRLLMCVNHEYAIAHLMFPEVAVNLRGRTDWSKVTAEMVQIQLAAIGVSVVELIRNNGVWHCNPNSGLNRRITARSTTIQISGPAAGDSRLQTGQDPTGRSVIGTLANCAGGVTPWGTYLTAEENFDDYFFGKLVDEREADNYQRLDIGDDCACSRPVPPTVPERFDLSKHPREANRFGWIVEIDPQEPDRPPVKRTALGRFKHEGAETVVNRDGRLVVYSGDDEKFQYLYRFVSRDRVSKKREQNRDLLDHGTLSVARLGADGYLIWLPLVHGEGPLTEQNHFYSQADVLIECRRAAQFLGATPMDRPEDIQPHPSDGRVVVVLTNNSDRGEDHPVDAANPRRGNPSGHIIELKAPGRDHTAERFEWQLLVLCGDPADPESGATWDADGQTPSWFVSPDNCTFDPSGRLWIASDQGSNWTRTGFADGLWALRREGRERGTAKRLYQVPVGAELCGPAFTPDGKTLFVAVQHPSADGTDQFGDRKSHSTFADPATRWPDFDPNMPPRPSVVAIQHRKKRRVGG
ncbi:MAG TPA: dTDP-glucose 4,6-dehydratase, partial [Gammaproteobacteria bacterium]|nr:dTDP-glucose 4,6-dehydratase [Gammaproteobacteria bacterium]